MVCTATLLLVVVGQAGIDKPQPDLQLQAKIREFYDKVEPMQFTSTIVRSGELRLPADPRRLDSGPALFSRTRFGGPPGAIWMMKTSFVSPRQFKIERRDLYMDKGEFVARIAVLWAKDGKVRSWVRDGDFGKGQVRDMPLLTPDMKPWSPERHLWDEFLPTYQHKMLFGHLDWLTTDWRIPSWQMLWGQESLSVKLERDGFRLHRETTVRRAMLRTQTDGWSVETVHSSWQKLTNAEAATAFTPPK